MADTVDTSNIKSQVLLLTYRLESAFLHGITTENLVQAVTYAMNVVETFTLLSGPQKKELVLESIRRVLQDTGSNTGVDALLDTMVPTLIDTIIVATKDGLILNKNRAGSKLSCCIVA